MEYTLVHTLGYVVHNNNSRVGLSYYQSYKFVFDGMLNGLTLIKFWLQKLQKLQVNTFMCSK